MIIYNDHMNYFDLKTYPTFAIGMAAHFPQADEGYGLRPFPGIDGDPEFAWPIARALVHDGFDLTFCQELELDHGVYSWLPYLLELPVAGQGTADRRQHADAPRADAAAFASAWARA